jgi:hypothetical protein
MARIHTKHAQSASLFGIPPERTVDIEKMSRQPTRNLPIVEEEDK